MTYPKRLIEIDLPIKKISAHARREKSIRHGHISTLHIWWARRPLAACRAVICAALWPDPVDENCPQVFRDAAAQILADFAEQTRSDAKVAGLVQEHWSRWHRTNAATFQPADNFAVWPDMRAALLDFIADFANWDASTVPAFLDTARALTQAAHESLGGLPGTRPLVVDPFAGGGAIPLEALRVGADAFASDLNPVAVLLNKVVLEYIPKYGQQLADEVRKWGQWINGQAKQELAEFYPKDPDGATPIAYLWTRTIICEGPGCGAQVPLMRSLWLAKKNKGSVALRITSNNSKTKSIDFDIIKNAKGHDVMEGTIRRGAVTCPVCGYTTPVESVRQQLKNRRGGTADARMIAIRRDDPKTGDRSYRLPNETDLEAAQEASKEMERRKSLDDKPLSLVPDESLPPIGTLGFRVQRYGIEHWGDLFTPRQALALSTFGRLIRDDLRAEIDSKCEDGLANAIQICLALCLDRLADFNSSLCILNVVGGRGVVHTFGRQAVPMVWDFMETNPFNEVGANWVAGIEAFEATIGIEAGNENIGLAERSSANVHPLPDEAAQCLFTDPPYYDAVPYADLADFFYVWLKRTLSSNVEFSFSGMLTPKIDECIVDPVKGKDRVYFEQAMGQAMAEGRRVLAPEGVGIVVFAHKSTSGWEAQLQAMIEAGWIMTGSWPIDTERPGRLRAQNSAALASSIHLVCRPRENPDGSIRTDDIGDWRDVLRELPERIHAWLPRLAREGVVGADAIFACLGPALEIFSRYSQVEKASGEQVTLKEYLEYVWAAVSKEALGMVFAGADATGFEEDARLTAMWLWTLRTDADQANGGGKEVVASTGYALEYDAARKIAQGLGAYLEKLDHLVEIKGSNARLLPVSARTRYLFGTQGVEAPRPARKSAQQLSLFDTGGEAEAGAGSASWGELSTPSLGQTTLDRVHQSMLLFAAGRSEALRRFLVEEGVGQDTRYWSLANALSALYPPNTDDKRWVDGVLARKKGLGF